MPKKNLFVWVVSLLGGIFALSAQAATPVTYSPNHYECLGNNIQVIYGQAGGDANLNRLTITINNQTYTATTLDITTESTLIGDLEEMVLKINPDVNTIHGSVVIPTVTLGTNALGKRISKAMFKSELIVTTVAQPFIAGPYVGVVNSSKYYPLNCAATFIPII